MEYSDDETDFDIDNLADGLGDFMSQVCFCLPKRIKPLGKYLRYFLKKNVKLIIIFIPKWKYQYNQLDDQVFNLTIVKNIDLV